MLIPLHQEEGKKKILSEKDKPEEYYRVGMNLFFLNKTESNN